MFLIFLQALLGAGIYMQYNTMEIFKHTTLLLSCAAFGGYFVVVVGMLLAVIAQQPVPKRAVSVQFLFFYHAFMKHACNA
jgi:uncharacterized membrane protein (DUF2068 family)